MSFNLENNKLEIFFDHLFNIVRSKLGYVLTLSIIFIAIFFLNRLTPLIGDDYVYSFIFSTTDKIASLNDIVNSQILHYNIWGGRSVVHFILQLVLLLNNQLFNNIINTTVFIVFLNVVQFHVLGKIKYKTSIIIIIFCLTFLLQPAFGETVLWLTGSINYMWGTTIILCFLLPYRIYRNANKKNNLLEFSLSIIFLLFGIIAGWTNENTSISIICMIALFIYSYKKQGWKIPLWSITGLIGASIGFVIMVIAPGNFARASAAGPTTIFLLLYRTLTYTELFIIYLSVLNLGLIIFAILNLNGRKIKFFNNLVFVSLIYAIGLLISIYSMIFSPTFPPRAWFGTITLNIILFGIMFNNLRYNLKLTNAIKYAVVLVCVVNVLVNYYEAYRDLTRIKSIWTNRIVQIEQAKADKDSTVVFEKYKADTKYGMSDAYYANEYVSNFYSITFKLE